MLGRRGLSLLDGHSCHGKALALFQSVREGAVLWLFCLFLPIGFPACVQYSAAFGGKAFPAAFHRDDGFRETVGRADGFQQAQRHQTQDFLFPRRQRGQIRPARQRGGDNGMVVADLGTVAYLGRVADFRGLGPADSGGHGGQGRDLRLHVICQIPAVCPGIGTELFFIQALQVVQGLLGGIAQGAVGVPLEGGQVIEGRRLFCPLLLFHGLKAGLLAFAGGGHGLGFRFCLQTITGDGKAVTVQGHGIERFRLERANLGLPFHNQRQRRGQDAAHVQRMAVQQGEQPCGVDAHQPVGLGTAQGRVMKPVIVPPVSQGGKAVLDGIVRHAGNPQPPHGLCAASQVVSGAED